MTHGATQGGLRLRWQGLFAGAQQNLSKAPTPGLNFIKKHIILVVKKILLSHGVDALTPEMRSDLQSAR